MTEQNTQTLVGKYSLEKLISHNETEGLADRLSAIPPPAEGIESLSHEEMIRQLQGISADKIYPSIDLSFLRMRNRDIASEWEWVFSNGTVVNWLTNLPRFAVYSLGSPDFELFLGYDRDKHSEKLFLKSPDLYEEFAPRYNIGFSLREGKWERCLDDFKDRFPKTRILDHLISGVTLTDKKPDVRRILEREEFDWLHGNVLVNHFTGLLPEKTRHRIRGARHIFQNEIYVIGEADDWKAEINQIKGPKDPLVIGLQGSNAFLIDSFDTTPIEKYVLYEFCDGKTSPKEEK